MAKKPVFSVIVITHNRLTFLKETLAALQRQTHEILEIIVVNNGSTDGTTEFLEQLQESDRRVILVHFEENQWSANDPNKPYAVSANAGLEKTTGDYVMLHFDDDILSDDYAQKIVSLFEENPECISAVGSRVDMDIEGNLIDEPGFEEHRVRYIPGKILALDLLKTDGPSVNRAQGCNFTFRREALVEAGGYHRSVDLACMFGIIPFGVTGFDETAVLHLRRYANTRPELSVSRAIVRVRDTAALLKEWQIERRWQAFDNSVAQEVVSGIHKRMYTGTAQWFIRLIYSLHFLRAIRLLMRMGTHRRFWLELPGNAFKVPQRSHLWGPARRLAKVCALQLLRIRPMLRR